MLLKKNNKLYLIIFLIIFVIILSFITYYFIITNDCYKKVNSLSLFIKIGFKCHYSKNITIGQNLLSIHQYDESNRYNSLYNKKMVDCGRNKKVILLLGQSNAANEVKSYNYKQSSNLNFFNNRCYILSNPVLGATGQKDNLAPAISNYLTHDDFIFLTLAWSGSSILDWGSDKFSYLSNYLKKQLNNILSNNNNLNYLIWIQGETDAKLFKKLNKGQGPYFFEKYGKDHFYIEAFKILINDLSNHLTDNTKVILTQTSICNNRRAEFINNQQKLISKISNNFLIIKETDNLNNFYRYDGCHLNERGVDHTARAIAKVINSLE